MSKVVSAIGPEGFGSYRLEWASNGPLLEKVSRPPESLFIPGFVDMHIHGAFGIDFMSATEPELTLLADKLEAQGYEYFLPTTVSAPKGAVLAAVEAMPDDPRMPGFHLEGPFINRLLPGAQPEAAIELPPDGASDWDEVFDHPKLKCVTLAPELPNALELIIRLRKRNVVVGMGHSNATFEEARRGFEFGATHTTHTFNAMREFHHREPGIVGYALSNPYLPSELIYDRVHVSREAAEILMRAKETGYLIAVSDGTMASGLPLNTNIRMWGHRCHVSKSGVRITESERLSGSAITLLDAFRNLFQDFGPEAAISACCLNPRKLLGSTSPRLYVELDKSLEIVQTHRL